jgi:sortase A
VRAALRQLANVLIVAGALLMVDAGLTVVWQEPVSAYMAKRHQDRLAQRLDDLDRALPTTAERRVLALLRTDRKRMAFLARSLKRRTEQGGALGRIRIPRIGASYAFVRGTDSGDLQQGPGLYAQTPLPGVGGTTAIAGHRTTYGAPFRHIDRLRTGDEIVVQLSYGRFTYAVERTRIVSPADTWVIRNVDHDRLVLSACHPLYSAAQRIVVFARLVKTTPRGAAASRTLVERPSSISR